MIRSIRSPGRLLIVGAVLLWVVSPLLIGGLVTVGVRAQNSGGIGAGVATLLVCGGVLALVVLLAGFAALLGGVVLWWRGRTGERLIDMTEDSARPPSRV